MIGYDGIERRKPRQCRCGSGLDSYTLYDARGIFCAFVCEKCEASKRAKYDPRIFAGPYEADEPIEPEDYC